MAINAVLSVNGYPYVAEYGVTINAVLIGPPGT